MAVVLSVCDVTYLAPEVHVAFIGIKGKESMVQTIKVDTPITVAKSSTVKEILLEAACARFSTTSGPPRDHFRTTSSASPFW